MKNTTNIAHALFGALPSRLSLWAQPFRPAAAVLLLMILTPGATFAGSATWQTSPASGNWNSAPNWMPNAVPNGPSDTATFAFSNKTDVSISHNTEVNGIVFNAGASAFGVTVPGGANASFLELTISGAGITNDSGIAQNFVTAPAVIAAGNRGAGIGFVNGATAGNLTAFTNNGGTAARPNGGFIDFFDSSTAGNGTFTNHGATVGGGLASQGLIFFFGASTAGNGTFINNGGAGNGNPGQTLFLESSTAGNGTFTNNASAGGSGGEIDFGDTATADNGTFTNHGATVSGAGGGETTFSDSSTAGNATLIANRGSGGGVGGSILFLGKSHGGLARVEVFGNGNLDLSTLTLSNSPSVTIGSIEGDGLVFLGDRNLTVGSNNLSTNFSGVIQDGGPVNTQSGGSLTKIGRGKLVLRHKNTYTGGTTIKRGKLIVNNKVGSGTGSGPVQVNAGKLGGRGIISGPVNVGTGSGSGAVLAPGLETTVSPGPLTIQSALTFHSDSSYAVQLNSTTGTADKVSASGVTIEGAAQTTFTDLGSSLLSNGTVLTVIDNTAATPIAGTFGNLADGTTFSRNGNTYRVSYEGGDGNDLTLTVVP